MSHESKSTLPSHERLSPSEHSIALKTRLALGGDALEVANTQVAKVGSQQELRTNFEQTHTNTESRIAKASVGKRLEYWSKQEVREESEQMKKWKGDVVTLCKKETHQNKIDVLAAHKIGGIDWKHITDEQVGQLYEKYFGASQTNITSFHNQRGEIVRIPSGTTHFVQEIVKTYSNPDGTVDYTSLHKDRSSLEFAAGIFGIGDLLFEYIDTITTLQDEKRTQALINTANQEVTPTSPRLRGASRINTLNPYEEEQLRLLSEGYEVKEEEIPLTPTQEPTTKEPIVVKPSLTDRAVVRPPHKPQQTREQPTNPWPEKIYVATPEQLIALPYQERIRQLPDENLRGALGFCNGLRARIDNAGNETKIEIQGQHTSKWTDKVTGINIRCPNKEGIKNAWFEGQGFLTWAGKHQLPMIYITQGDIHATLLLKMEKRGNKLGYRGYDPLQKGDLWYECREQITKEQFIKEILSNSEYYEKDGKIWQKGSTVNGVTVKDLILNNILLAERYLRRVTGHPVRATALGGDDFMKDQYDFTLEGDPELPKEIVLGKIQQMQFDGINCQAIAFYNAALRYTAKQGKEDEKIQLIKDFENDFPGIRFLTRKEILGKKQQTQAQPIVLSSSTTHSQAADRIKFGVLYQTDLLQLTPGVFDNLPIVVSYENNLARARDFIRILDEARTTARPDPNDNRFLINKFNFRFESNPPYWYDVLSAVTNPGSRYGLPIMIYTPGNHANLVLKVFKSPDGQYKMIYWDPMSADDKGKNLSPVKVETLSDEVSKRVTILAENRTESDKILQANHIYENDMVISHDDYDLTIAGDRELADPVYIAKAGTFQTDDARNCVPLCIYAAMLRQAAKYTKDNHPWYLDAFFERGLDQFYEDFGIPIATREQLQKRNS